MSGEPLLGSIGIFGGNFAPRGWAFCEGQLLPIAQNSALFSILGTTYGGDGRTTFALPDLRGRAPIGPGNGPGLSSYRLGEKGGTENVTLNVTNMPAHSHMLNGLGGTNDSNFLQNNYLASNRDVKVYGTLEVGETLIPLNGQSIGTAGGNQSHTNMQPYLALNYCIALVGLFPSRS